MKDSVLIITEVFHPEEFLINDVARQWAAEGKRVSVLTRNPAYPFGKIFSGYKNKFFSKTDEGGISVYRYHILDKYRDNKFRKMLNYLWNTVLSSFLALLLMREHKNIFIYHTGPLTMALSGVLLKKVNGGKITIWTQDVWPEVAFAYGLKKNIFTNWMIERFVNFIYRNSNTIITTSRPLQFDISQRVKLIPEFIPNWPMNVFHQTLSSTERRFKDTIKFTFAGNIGSMQNLEIIIQAFHIWAKNSEKVQLNIYGDGSALNDLRRLVAVENIHNVHLHGRVPVSEIPSIYSNSNVLLISLGSNKVMEKYVPAKFSTYLVARKPILAVLSGAVADYVNEFRLGYVAEPNDMESIIKGFKHMVDLSPQDLEGIQSRAETLFHQEFDAETNLKKLTDLVFS